MRVADPQDKEVLKKGQLTKHTQPEMFTYKLNINRYQLKQDRHGILFQPLKRK